jgi:hypothetical protein
MNFNADVNPMPAGRPVIEESGRSPARTARLILAAICILFVAARLPVLLRQIPAQDEDYFAVPGLTILNEGVPRIPYMPSRNPDSAFFKADEMLFALPPLYFYLEAPVYLLLGPGTGSARVLSMLCGVAAILMVYSLANRIFASRETGLWSAGLYAASRILYFPCVIARPDMLCGALGLATLLAMSNWWTGRRRRWIILAGLFIGLGMLSHPFAFVYAVQAGIWSLIASGSPLQRLARTTLLTLIALAVFSVWSILILQHPEAFRAQFFNNVLNQAGPGLLTRLVWPFPSVAAQTPLFLDHAGPIQAPLMLIAGLAALALAFRQSAAGWRIVAALAGSAVYLHVASVGLHPTKGYWCYTGALLFICLGACVTALLDRLGPPDPTASASAAVPGFRRIILPRAVLIVVAALLLLPGAGVRTVLAHVRHWNDINYDAPKFTQRLIADLPPDARLVVDPGYIFDFYRAGRDVTLALDYDFFFTARGTDYDYIVGGPYSLRDKVPQALGARLLRTYGDRNDLFACYAEIYVSPDRPDVRLPGQD